MVATLTDIIRGALQFPKRMTAQPGFTLTELMISMIIFGIVIVPLVALPIKTAKRSDDLSAQSLTANEVKHFESKLQDELGQSYLLLPIGSTPGFTTVDQDFQHFFFAYWDESNQEVVRVGYKYEETGSFTPKHYKIYRTVLTENSDLECYQDPRPAGAPCDDLDTNPNWSAIGVVVSAANLYFTNSTEANGVWSYCKDLYCDLSLDPNEVTALRILQGKITAHYTSSTEVMPGALFKLAGLLAHQDRSLAKNKVLPFAMSTRVWTAQTMWLREVARSVNYYGSTADYKTPVAHNTEAEAACGSGVASENGVTVPADSCLLLHFNDPHFNYKTGEIVVVSNSNSHNPTSAKQALYIFKLRPGVPDYPPFSMNLNGLPSTSESFPITLNEQDTWYVPNAQAISVTQDDQDNIYALVENASSSVFWILKFSSQGRFVSRFPLEPSLSDVKGITFDPASPEEVIVLAKEGSNWQLRTYNKNTSSETFAYVKATGVSANLDTTDVLGTGGLYDWDNAEGIEYDPLHHRYLVLFGTAAVDARIISFDIDFSNTNGTPFSRAVTINKLYKQDSLTPLVLPEGIAFNPLSNTVYLVTGNKDPRLYEMVPNHKLNPVYKLQG